MTKQKWQEHRLTAGPHEVHSCEICKARIKTIKASVNRKLREDVYRSLGMVKGRTGLGRVIWE